ncbi:MAG: hypothetical protein K6A75_07250 [Ruminococcus sp.]|nr:hypothetical protein [Ruminococcus sp.]
MRKMTAILAMLALLTGCGQEPQIYASPPPVAEAVTVSAEKKESTAIQISATSAVTTTVTTSVYIMHETATMQETTAISVTEPVSYAVSADIQTEVQSTTKTTEVPQTTTATHTTTTTVPQTSSPTTTVTEPPIEPKTILPNDGSDYGKAEAVYEYMRQNGCGTCVNYACLTYELCEDNGLECLIVWTGAGLFGHVANIVRVDGIWYVLDTEGGYFLDYNYCFTEVVDIDGNHIADSSIISDKSYDELH